MLTNWVGSRSTQGKCLYDSGVDRDISFHFHLDSEMMDFQSSSLPIFPANPGKITENFSFVPSIEFTDVLFEYLNLKLWTFSSPFSFIHSPLCNTEVSQWCRFTDCQGRNQNQSVSVMRVYWVYSMLRTFASRKTWVAIIANWLQQIFNNLTKDATALSCPL